MRSIVDFRTPFPATCTKRLLASDSRDIWQGIYEFIEQDEQAYQQRLQQKGIDFIL